MSLAATKIQEIRLNNPDFDKNEHRLSEYGAFDFFVRQSETSPILTEEMKRQAIEGAGKVFKMPVIDYDGAISIQNSRTCTIADAENTSKLIGLTWVTYACGFTMVPAMYSNNEIDYNTDFAKKLKKCARIMGAALDEASLSALEGAKTQVINDPLIYTDLAHVLQVPFASREDILSDLEPIFTANDFYGSLHVIGNAGMRSLLNKLMEKSTYQEIDKDLEWNNKAFHFSNRLTNEEGKYSTFYAVEDGNVDVLFRFDREAARRATSKVDGHEWDIINMPYLNIPVGLHYYESVGDVHTIGGDATTDMTCNIKEHYGFSVDVAFVTSYNSAPASRPNPILKVEVDKGATYAQPVTVVNGDKNPVATKTVAGA